VEYVVIFLNSAIVAGIMAYCQHQQTQLIKTISDKLFVHLTTHSRVGDLAVNKEQDHLQRMKELEIEELKVTASLANLKAQQNRVFRSVDPQG
jgi:hypothetical protein